MGQDTAVTETVVSSTALPESLPAKDSSQVDSDTKAERVQIQALLKEARSTRDVLVGFRSAVETGTYHGGKMLDIAKGLSFLEAILNQNQAHLHNLQARLEAKE